MKRTEEAFQESEEKYRLLFHRSNDGIFIHDLDGNIVDTNQKVLELFGYTKSEIASIKVPMLHPAESLEKSKLAFDKIIREGFVRFEIEFNKKNGETFSAEVSSSLFEIKSKKVIQGIVRDITERKRVEKAIRKSEAKHKALIKNIPGMVYRAFSDWSAEIVSGSDKISGYTNAELNSKEKNWLSIIHPDDIEQVFDEGSVLVTRPKDIVQTYRIITKNGNIKWKRGKI